jgi:hypothetical protein
MQYIAPFEMYVFNGLELNIQVQQRSIGEWDKYIFVKGNDALVDDGESHLNSDQKQPGSHYPVRNLWISFGRNHQSRKKRLRKPYIKYLIHDFHANLRYVDIF